MTDPYTPTTEEVRDVHHTCPHCGTRGVIRTEAWLAQHDAELRAQIALEIRDLVDDMGDPAPGWRAGIMHAARIAEGEQ